MTMRDLLPGVYTALRLAAFDISDNISFIQSIDSGEREYKTDEGRARSREKQVNEIRRRIERAKVEVTGELTRAGRPDLVGPFQRFIDRYLGKEHAGKMIENVFAEERTYKGPTTRGMWNRPGQYTYDLLDEPGNEYDKQTSKNRR